MAGSGSDRGVFRVNKRPTTLAYVGYRTADPGGPLPLKAKLRNVDNLNAVAGKPIQFVLDSLVFTATTDASGIAAITPTVTCPPASTPSPRPLRRMDAPGERGQRPLRDRRPLLRGARAGD